MKHQIFSDMKNKTYIYYAIAAAVVIYYFTKMKKVTGIEQEAAKLSQEQASKLKFGIDMQTMQDIYNEQREKY